MGTIRIAKRARWTTVNRETINDERLSFRARGILVWLLDKPDDWRVDRESISRQGKEGRDAVAACLKELTDFGYLVRSQEQNEKGQWVTETVLYETPGTGFQSPVNQSAVNPSAESQSVIEVLELSTETKTEKEPSSRPRDLHWDAMVEGLKLKPTTPATQKRFGKCKKQLVDAGASPESIIIACENYRKMWPGITLTPEALVKHYDAATQYKPEPKSGVEDIDWDALKAEHEAAELTRASQPPTQQKTLPETDWEEPSELVHKRRILIS